MINKTFSEDHATKTLILFFLGSSLALHNASGGGYSNWISMIIATIAALILFYIYSYMLTSVEGAENFYDVHIFVYGKKVGTFVNILYAFFPLYLASTITREYGEYSLTVSIPDTPLIVPLLFMGLLCAYVCNFDIHTLGRWSNLFFILDSPLPTLIFFLTIPLLNIENILPVMGNGIKPVLEGSLYAIGVPFGEGIVFLLLTIKFPNKNSYRKVFRNSILISGFTLVGVCLIEMMILGQSLYEISYFPAHTIAKKISIAQILERLEPIVLLATATAAFAKISVCLLAFMQGIQHLFNLEKYKIISLPCGIIMVLLSFILHDNILDLMNMYAHYKDYFSHFYCLYVPLITLVILMIKLKLGYSFKKSQDN